jgi:hypothetical protein
MHSRYTKVLTALAVTGAVAVPAVAQAQGGSDDPPNHEQRQQQVRNHVRHDRFDNDRGERRHDRFDNDRRERRHDRFDNDRRDGRGSDDGPNHR